MLIDRLISGFIPFALRQQLYVSVILLIPSPESLVTPTLRLIRCVLSSCIKSSSPILHTSSILVQDFDYETHGVATNTCFVFV